MWILKQRKESPDDDSRLTKRPRPDRQSPLGVALFEDSKVSNEGTPAFANAALATNDTSDEAKQTKDGATQEFAMSLSSTINRRSYKRRRLPRKGSSQANQGRLSEQRTAIPASKKSRGKKKGMVTMMTKS